jgi:adenylate cyclase
VQSVSRPSSSSTRKVVLMVIAAIVVAIGGAGAWLYSQHQPAPAVKLSPTASTSLPLPDKPSIAVLPFVNMSGDKEQEYFSDGMTEDVITSLSKLSGLFVIARNSVFTYKGQAVKPEQVSKELGVRYVLEGSVRKAQNQVRITAQLIDATTGYHLWAENYDGELKDIFALQDSITKKIVSALAPKLTASEETVRNRRETANVEAYDLVLRGVSLLSQTRKESNAMARYMFQQAIALDPNYAKAYARVAWTHHMDWVFQWTEGRGSLDLALKTAKKAVDVDVSSSEAHLTFGWNLLYTKQQDLGVSQLEKAVSLDPNFSEAYAHLAQALNFTGRPDEAIGFVKKAMRLDPNYAPWVGWFLGNSYYALRRYDEAVAAYQEALRRNPNALYVHLGLAGVYAELSREKDARAEVVEILKINPAFSLNWARDNTPFKNPADLERYIEGLRKAGLK